MMEIYITCLLQILSFSSRFIRFEIKNFLRQPTMVADNNSWLVASPEFFSFLLACISIVYDSFILELNISISITTAVLLWR